jgi:hypothetical protein
MPLLTDVDRLPDAHFCAVSSIHPMLKLILWCVLFVLCWPLAVLALVLYPIVWLLLVPFRLLGIAVGAVLDLVWAIVTLPARILRGLAGPGREGRY